MPRRRHIKAYIRDALADAGIDKIMEESRVKCEARRERYRRRNLIAKRKREAAK